jgi:hypothetical protein
VYTGAKPRDVLHSDSEVGTPAPRCVSLAGTPTPPTQRTHRPEAVKDIYMIDETVDNATPTTAPTSRNISNEELLEFRAFRESKIRDAGMAEGRAAASAEHLANEAAADAAAMKKLTDKNLSLKDAFGHSSTNLGRGVLINISRSSFGSRDGAYVRLRRMAAAANLVQ